MDFVDLLLTHDDLFHNGISALAAIECHRKEARNEDSYTTADQHTKKHVRLLDALSLLFIFHGSGEVCATTFNHDILDSKEATILWVKNDPANPSLL